MTGFPWKSIFFRKGSEYARQWRDAFQTYLSDSVTGRNFEIVGMGDVEERNFGQVIRERDIQYFEGEICLELLTPFPFKPGKGKPRTYISKTAFIRSFERRFSRLFGREIVYSSQDDQFSLLPYYWNYTEIRHASISQPGQTQYINGCVGKLYIKGHFRDFLPFLLLGSQAHIGTSSLIPRDITSCTKSRPVILTPHIAFTIKKRDGVDRLVEQIPFRDFDHPAIPP